MAINCQSIRVDSSLLLARVRCELRCGTLIIVLLWEKQPNDRAFANNLQKRTSVVHCDADQISCDIIPKCIVPSFVWEAA